MRSEVKVYAYVPHNIKNCQILPRQTGAAGVKVALFPSVACVQVATA